MRVVLADDALIVLEGLARLLAAAGVEVVDQVGDVDGLLRSVTLHRPDIAIVDMRMPPTFTTEGLQAAKRLATTAPSIGVLVLSQYADPAFAASLLQNTPSRRGYLLKERITNADTLVGALYRIHAGETVVDPAVIESATDTPAGSRRLAQLTEREREVLRCMATGLTDKGICDELTLSPKTVATHISHIFTKLALPDSASDNRRVHAVLAYLDSG